MCLLGRCCRALLQPVEGIKKSAENLGEHLTGELIENSGYEVRGRTIDAPAAVLWRSGCAFRPPERS